MFVKSVTPMLENRMYGSKQHNLVCISEALRLEVIASKKTVFQVRYLRWQVPMGSNRGSSRAARTKTPGTKWAISFEECLWCSQDL